MANKVNIILYCIILPLFFFFVFSMFLQSANIGKSTIGFPFKYYIWSSGNCGEYFYEPCEYYNPIALILDIIFVYLISGIIYYLSGLIKTKKNKSL